MTYTEQPEAPEDARRPEAVPDVGIEPALADIERQVDRLDRIAGLLVEQLAPICVDSSGVPRRDSEPDAPGLTEDASPLRVQITATRDRLDRITAGLELLSGRVDLHD